MSKYLEIIQRIEASRAEGLKPQVLTMFSAFLNEYNDEIPEEILTPQNTDYKLYKCRKSFFLNIARYANLLVKEGVVQEPEAIKECQDFVTYFENVIKQKSDVNKITHEDIEVANRFLTSFIKYLSKKS